MSYFDFETSAAKVQSKRVAADIRSTVWKVDNLTGVSFRDNYYKAVIVYETLHIPFVVRSQIDSNALTLSCSI